MADGPHGVAGSHPQIILLDWGNGRAVRLADVLAGVCVFGTTGSSKTRPRRIAEAEPVAGPSQADIREGFDATDPDCFRNLPTGSTFDFVWAHPPYWRQKLYTSDSRDLSRTPTLDAFLERYAAFIENCASILSARGKFAILMGDYSDRQAGFVPLTHHTKQLAFDAGLRQHCTDIIRFSHGASSSRKVYRSSFIPGLHDVCMVFERV